MALFLLGLSMSSLCLSVLYHYFRLHSSPITFSFFFFFLLHLFLLSLVRVITWAMTRSWYFIQYDIQMTCQARVTRYCDKLVTSHLLWHTCDTLCVFGMLKAWVWHTSISNCDKFLTISWVTMSVKFHKVTSHSPQLTHVTEVSPLLIVLQFSCVLPGFHLWPKFHVYYLLQNCKITRIAYCL